MAAYDTTGSACSTQPKGSVTHAYESPFEAYDEKIAAADLSKYRTKGSPPWARTLIDAIKAEGVDGATLLDIGGGIGVIQHELLASGAARATNVEASSAYLSVARSESERRGLGDRVTYYHGDFVDLAESIQSADVVTLDRVLNVYPDWERLASLSAERARRLYGVVIPRDTPFVRVVIAGINVAQRLRRKRVRAAIVPIDALERTLRARGLHRRFSENVGPAWRVLLYRHE
jgi:magnesium-protoporphyrin O-methyltransferase